MYDISHIKFLKSTEIIMFREVQEFLRLDAEDIRFRAYDLLFSCYPDLRRKLPDDRYTHPEIAAILFNTKEEVVEGITAIQILLSLLPARSEKEYIDNVSLIKQCLIKSLRDVLFDAFSTDQMRVYSKIIEQRMLDVIKENAHRGLGVKPCVDIRTAAS